VSTADWQGSWTTITLLHPGGAPVVYTITSSSVNGFTGQILFTGMELPSGISATFDQMNCIVSAGGSCSVNYTIKVAPGIGYSDLVLRFTGSNAPNLEAKSVTASLHVVE
jgi:hypothetical protein